MSYKRPANLIYTANKNPPFFELLGLALQYTGVAATFLILPVIITQESAEHALKLLRVSSALLY